ncbi:helicase associated domain-containing protein [Streptomyces polyrhachis]|uniref:Helicase associated domain-containing protein n=1 Tax=Streptomyces polyrhachis TaxID=1282885 RepID=A0ABW2GMF6_9ACTN
MIWDPHEASWQGNLTTAAAYHQEHGHLAIPITQPAGQFLIDQRAAARKGRLTPDREAQLTTLDRLDAPARRGLAPQIPPSPTR